MNTLKNINELAYGITDNLDDGLPCRKCSLEVINIIKSLIKDNVSESQESIVDKEIKTSELKLLTNKTSYNLSIIKTLLNNLSNYLELLNYDKLLIDNEVVISKIDFLIYRKATYALLDHISKSNTVIPKYWDLAYDGYVSEIDDGDNTVILEEVYNLFDVFNDSIKSGDILTDNELLSKLRIALLLIESYINFLKANMK